MNKKHNSRIKTLRNNRRIKRSKRSKKSKVYKRSKRSKRSKNKRKNKRSYKMKGGASAAMDAGLSRSRQRRTTRPETWAWRWGDGGLFRIWSMYYSKDEIVEVLKTRREDIPVELYSTAKNKTHKADNPAKAIQWLTEPIIYRIGIELEGCHDFTVHDKDLNVMREDYWVDAPINNYPAIVIPHYKVEDRYSIIEEMEGQLTHFDLERENFPCKLSKDLSKKTFPGFEKYGIISRKGLRFLIENSPQFRDGEENKCSLELILKNGPYYTCLSQFDSMYLTETTDVTAEMNRDIERIMQKLDPPLHGGLDDDLTKAGLELHLHVSDQNDKVKGLDFLDPKTLKFCMTICLLWYGCPGHCDSFYDEFVKLGYNFDSRLYPGNAYQNPEGNPVQSRRPPHFQMVEDYRATPEIEWEEFKQIFEGLNKEEPGREECIFYLLTTMYPNRTKYMPIHIYNLKFILELVNDCWVLGQNSGVEIKGENIVEMLRFILTSSETSDIRSIKAMIVGREVKMFAREKHGGPRKPRPFNLLNVYDELLYCLTESTQMDDPVPLRIEFRNSKFRKTSPVEFLTNYTKMITIFFDYAKKMSEEFSSPEEIKLNLKTPMEVFKQCGHISVFPPMVVGPETFNGFNGPRDLDLSEYGFPEEFMEYIRKMRKRTLDSHLPKGSHARFASMAAQDPTSADMAKSRGAGVNSTS